MSDKSENEPAVFVSNDEFLQGFHRTREGLHAFDGIDLDELTRQGVESYWKARESDVRDTAGEQQVATSGADLATARLARKYGAQLGLGKLPSGTARVTIGVSAAVVAVSSLVFGWDKLRRLVTRSLRRVPGARAVVK